MNWTLIFGIYIAFAITLIIFLSLALQFFTSPEQKFSKSLQGYGLLLIFELFVAIVLISPSQMTSPDIIFMLTILVLVLIALFLNGRKLDQ